MCHHILQQDNRDIPGSMYAVVCQLASQGPRSGVGQPWSMMMIVYNAIYLRTKLLSAPIQYVRVSTIASMIRMLSGI